MTSEEYDRILQPLREEFHLAALAVEAANEKFDAIVREVPSGLPHPDGARRVQNVSRELSQARADLMVSTQRLNGFIARGEVPYDLKNLIR